MRKRKAKDRQIAGYRIAGIGVDPGRQRLLVDDHEVKLEPKVMAVLVVLIRRFPVVVQRGELIAEVWEQTVVSDETVTMAVSKLRRALNDDPRAPRIIETIPKGGYRLMMEPEPLAARELAASSSAEAPRRPAKLALLALAACLIAMAGFALRSRPPAEVAPDLLESRPLTALPGREIHPAMSPDGRHVVFVHQRNDGLHDLFLRGIEDESLVRLTDDPAVELRPTWSPDGVEIAYARIDDGRCEFVRRAVRGPQARQIADCGETSSPDLAWSPDGEWLAFPDRSGPERGIGIVRLSLHTGERRFITDPADPAIHDLRPAFSPAGSLLAFVRRQTDGHSELFEVPVEGGETRRVTAIVEHLWGHAWTSDGQGLIYASLIGDTFALQRIDREGGNPRWLPILGVEIARDPSTARQVDALVFEDWSYDANILRLRPGAETAETAEPRAVVPSTAWDSAPQLSPDGTMLSFVSSRSGGGGLWVSDVDGSRPRRLATGVRTIESVPRWSPASDHLVFVTGKQQDTQIAVVEVASGKVVSAGVQTTGGRAPAWSADGQALYFASTRGGSWQVWKTRLGIEEAAPVTRDGGFSAQESSDGSWLYFTRPRASGLWRKSVQGGAAEKILDDLEPSAWGNWQLFGDAVIFARADTEGNSVVHLNLETRQERVVAMLPGQILNPGLAVSPDGQTVWFSRLDNSESDLRWVATSLTTISGPS